MAGSDAETLLRSLMENIPGAIYRSANDSQWSNLLVSGEIESLTGYPAEDFAGGEKRTIVSVTHPDDREPVAQQIAAALAEHKPFALEYRIMHADGGIRWVLERGVKAVDGEGTEWIDGIIFDITDRRAAEQLRLERELEAAHVAELKASRARIVAAGDAARRRIERDLQLGGRKRLLAAAERLRGAEEALAPGSDAAAALRAARAELEAGLEELSDLARGIHPAVLTERGLGPAVRALAERCAVPVEVGDAIAERLPREIETALYYAVSEALTNVDRYAAASRATVRLGRRGDGVEIEVADDGRGGADSARGSGLRGLEDRLGAVGGALELDSPAGRGTRLRARVPL